MKYREKATAVRLVAALIVESASLSSACSPYEYDEDIDGEKGNEDQNYSLNYRVEPVRIEISECFGRRERGLPKV